MAILIDRATRALIQGMTGDVGSFQTRIMRDYGTHIVAGVTPGKGGQFVDGVPIYDFVEDAVLACQPNAALSFVPAPLAADAALEALETGLHLVVVTAEGVPDSEMLSVLQLASRKEAQLVGPDTPGIISPGKCKLGVHPDRMFREGHVGVVSKSGALSYEVCKNLTARGLGQSTVVGIGGGPLWGLSQGEALKLFQQDPETHIIVLLGEVGGTMEQEAARVIKTSVTKPVVAMIVGRAAPRGAQMGHAGAIIEGEDGLAIRKMECLQEAGALLARHPSEIADLVEALGV